MAEAELETFKYFFSGVVLPERATFHFDGQRLMHFENPLGFAGSVAIEIKHNQVAVKLEMRQHVGARLEDLASVVRELVYTEIDVISLYSLTYRAFDLELFVDIQTGVTEFFYPRYSERHSKSLSEVDTAVIALASHNMHFRIALSNLRRALEIAVDSGFYCYRAYESLLQFICISTTCSKKTAVKTLSRELAFDEQWGEMLRDLGSDARHGKPVLITGECRDKAIEFVQLLLFRFRDRYGPENRSSFQQHPFA